ncbi:MAG: ribosome maturation factor RimM [Alcaligenaceae bacterium]|nr:ribosome maturation factor RimM [Alcaligenaceae bacterium]
MRKSLSENEQSSTTAPTDLVELGHITGAFGVRGMVKIKPYSAESILPEVTKWWLQRRLPPARTAQKTAQREAHQLFEVAECRWHADSLIASFPEVTDRDVADSLKGMVISVSRADFPTEDSDEFYWVDLVGCWVYTVDESAVSELAVGDEDYVLLGRIRELSDNGVHAVLHIDRYLDSGDPELEPQALLNAKGQPQQSLVPFVDAHVLEVDLENNWIEVDWPLDF